MFQYKRTSYCSIFLVSEIVIGYRYSDKCPIEPRIPSFLIIDGIIGLIIIALLVGYVVIFVTYVGEDNSSSPRMAAIIPVILCLFLVVWVIFGCVLVFRVNSSVQFEYPNQDTYCHHTLYRFVFFILAAAIFSVVVQGLRCCCLCCKS